MDKSKSKGKTSSFGKKTDHGTGCSPKSTKISATISRWLEKGTTKSEEFVVQAEVPKSKAHFSFPSGCSPFRPVRLNSISPHSQADQIEDILSRLFLSIQEIVAGQAVLLKAAKAISVRANPEQLRQILTLPGIREILPNRKLRPS